MPIIIAGAGRAGSAPAALRRKGQAKADGARFTVDGTDGPAAEAPAGLAFVCPTALLQIQEAPEPAGGRAAVVRRGTDLLDRLDDLRLALLAGRVSPARLKALADALSTGKSGSNDPRLDEIIAEIELRAAVELAKLNRERARR